MREITVRITGTGKMLVPDKWTDKAIEADPEGFDAAILEYLPDAIIDSRIDVTVDDAS